MQQIKAANADVLMPSSYTTDGILLVKTMAELGYKPKRIVAQAAGFSEKAVFDAVGDKLEGVISRASFSLDLAAKRPSIGKVNEMFKARRARTSTTTRRAQFMALLVLADAIDRAKSTDGEKIREALAATDMPGERTIMPWKRVKFDETGRTTMPIRCCCNMSAASSSRSSPNAGRHAEPNWPMNQMMRARGVPGARASTWRAGEARVRSRGAASFETRAGVSAPQERGSVPGAIS